MSTRIQNARRKRKHRQPPMVGGGKRTFETRLTSGDQIERRYRRMYPLSDADLTDIHGTVKRDVKTIKEGRDWVFVRFQVSIQGSPYTPMFENLFDDDEEPEWKRHWVSTRAVPIGDKAALTDAIEDLMGKKLEGFFMGRPAWINRIETVTLKNESRKPTPNT